MVSLMKKAGLPEETIRNLRPQAPVPPRLYGLPKIHKEGIPLRPIVSAINSPTSLLAKFLSKLLTPHIENSIHHIKNSSEFVNSIRNLHLDPVDIMDCSSRICLAAASSGAVLFTWSSCPGISLYNSSISMEEESFVLSGDSGDCSSAALASGPGRVSLRARRSPKAKSGEDPFCRDSTVPRDDKVLEKRGA
ncbi:hypothetical protein J437_LFUL016536 [Ladona fulva]|uniref:Reverse transcriptase n=1 Tax=Ladona fulva TaxID=123851 RepID=A0A8K0KLE5_LADFU|nr:hypothetical protein J437_LFUL016536 [Ladona fulva]